MRVVLKWLHEIYEVQCVESAIPHYTQFRNYDCEKRRISLLRSLCIRTRTLNAQLTLGTARPLGIAHLHQSVLQRRSSDCSEKLTTETAENR